MAQGLVSIQDKLNQSSNTLTDRSKLEWPMFWVTVQIRQNVFTQAGLIKEIHSYILAVLRQNLTKYQIKHI